MENVILERVLRSYQGDIVKKIRKIANVVEEIAESVEEFKLSDLKSSTEPSGDYSEWNLKTWREAAEKEVTVSFKYRKADMPSWQSPEFKTLIQPIECNEQLLLGLDNGRPKAYRIDRIEGYVIASDNK